MWFPRSTLCLSHGFTQCCTDLCVCAFQKWLHMCMSSTICSFTQLDFWDLFCVSTVKSSPFFYLLWSALLGGCTPAGLTEGHLNCHQFPAATSMGSPVHMRKGLGHVPSGIMGIGNFSCPLERCCQLRVQVVPVCTPDSSPQSPHFPTTHPCLAWGEHSSLLIWVTLVSFACSNFLAYVFLLRLAFFLLIPKLYFS